MLHTKFRENRPDGSGEDDFLRVFTIYSQNWSGDHLSSATSRLVRPHLGPPVHFSM